MTNKALKGLWICLIGASLFWIAFRCAGCAQNKTSESVTVSIVDNKPVSVRYEFEVKQNLLGYYTQQKQSELVTPFMSACVGDIESYPDPNSVKAGVQGLTEGIMLFK